MEPETLELLRAILDELRELNRKLAPAEKLLTSRTARAGVAVKTGWEGLVKR